MENMTAKLRWQGHEVKHKPAFITLISRLISLLKHSDTKAQ